MTGGSSRLLLSMTQAPKLSSVSSHDCLQSPPAAAHSGSFGLPVVGPAGGAPPLVGPVPVGAGAGAPPPGVVVGVGSSGTHVQLLISHTSVLGHMNARRQAGPKNGMFIAGPQEVRVAAPPPVELPAMPPTRRT